MTTFTNNPNPSKKTATLKTNYWLWGMLCLSVLVAIYAFTLPWMLEFLPTPIHSGFLERSFTLFLFHVIAAGIALIIGPIQFILARHFPRHPSLKTWHSNLGRIYLMAVIIGTIGGTYLSFYAQGGLISTIGLLTLNALWISSTLIAVWHILNANVIAHKKWMTRSFALTFAAVTLRLEMPLLGIFFEQVTVSQIVYWSCWSINLLVVELWMRLKKS
ncbi:DUF2306 domain-containing protein [Marinicellulosiphila megalodicopiae]|uniref:DUF2306 domain-containing protein n=1 Tax=Marinicellulosiphila megalodicopiae TaxID=2724896 RepID=UPI003BB1535D